MSSFILSINTTKFKVFEIFKKITKYKFILFNTIKLSNTKEFTYPENFKIKSIIIEQIDVSTDIIN